VYQTGKNYICCPRGSRLSFEGPLEPLSTILPLCSEGFQGGPLIGGPLMPPRLIGKDFAFVTTEL